MKVLVIGAGPAGCALASGLKKANIDFAMYDKGASAHRNRYWAFTLGWARPYLQKLLPDHLAEHLSQCQVDPKLDSAAIGEDRIVMYNGQTREERYSFPTPHAMEMNIRKLREFMSAELPVQYNKILTRYELLPNDKGVRVYFSDGTSDEGDVVAGFDGAGSMVRQQLLGLASHADLLPFTLMNFIASYTAEQALYIKEKLHPLVDIAVHPAGHYIRFNVLDMPDHDKPETWTFQILSTWPVKNVEDYDNEGERLSRLKAYVKKEGWAEPYKSTIEWIPDDTEVLRDQLKIWKPVKWDNHNGRVTLGGDAAHAMTFHRGQGANNAFFDAYCFVEAIKTVVAGTASLEKAIGEYSDAVLKRGQGEVQVSKTQTFFTHDWEHFLNSPVIGLGTRPSHDAPSEGYQ